MNKKIVAFDLDGVIVNKPPIISKKLLEKLFKGSKKTLVYRFPHCRLEQAVRKLSHFYLLRPPIRENIKEIRRFVKKNPDWLVVAVSARYKFLEEETYRWLSKRGVKKLFSKVYLNLDNEQPHIFKEKILKNLGVKMFVDDDGTIADYLCKNPKIKVFFYCTNGEKCSRAKTINRLKEMWS